MDIATDIEFKANVDKYLKSVEDGNEVAITRNGNRLGKIVPERKANLSRQKLSRSEVDNIIQSLTGIISGDYDLNEVKDSYLRAKYDSTR